MRASLSQEASRISSRVQKVLEDANVKWASVATNTVGKSGRAMLEEIIAGQKDPEHLASLALGHLRAKNPGRSGLSRRYSDPSRGTHPNQTTPDSILPWIISITSGFCHGSPSQSSL